MKNLHVDEKYKQFALISNYNVISSKNDFCIDSSKTDNDIYIKIHRNSWFSSKENVIDMTRIHDLDMLSKLNNFGFNIPPYIYSHEINNVFKHMEYRKEYLIKSFYSARSLGQMKVTKETILHVFEYAYGNSKEDFNKKFNIDCSTANNSDEEFYLHENIIGGKIYVSECIEFKEEYRVLAFKGTPPEDWVVEHRQGYQVNSIEDRTHHVVTFKDSKITPFFLKKLESFLDSQPSPMLSFDIYVTESGGIGLFEYSTQFGIDYKNYFEIIQNQMEKSINYAITELDDE